LQKNLKQKLHLLFPKDQKFIDGPPEPQKQLKKAKSQHISYFGSNQDDSYKRQFGTGLDRNRDSWEMATNWVRSFVDIYQDIFYLNSFARLNRVACGEALHKICKKFLEKKENVLDKKMMRLTRKFKFY
jgi:hypothetical protein